MSLIMTDRAEETTAKRRKAEEAEDHKALEAYERFNMHKRPSFVNIISDLVEPQVGWALGHALEELLIMRLWHHVIKRLEWPFHPPTTPPLFAFSFSCRALTPCRA